MFHVGAHVHYLHSTDELVFAQIVGPSPYNDMFRTRTYTRNSNPLTHDMAPLTRLTELQASSSSDPHPGRWWSQALHTYFAIQGPHQPNNPGS